MNGPPPMTAEQPTASDVWVAAQHGQVDDLERLLKLFRTACSHGSQWQLLLQKCLRVAVINDHIAAITALIAAGAEVADDLVYTASLCGHGHAVLALVAAKGHVGTRPGQAPLHAAAGCNHVDVAEALLGLKADVNGRDQPDGQTPLHFAASRGCYETVAQLLRRKAAVDARTWDGKTPLAKACQCREDAAVATVDALLSAKADLHASCQDGDTPLHVASLASNTPTVGALLRAKADVHARGSAGWSPLAQALADPDGDVVATVKALVMAKANVNGSCPTTPVTGPLQRAVQMRDQGLGLQLLKCLIGCKADVNLPDCNGVPPLPPAAGLGSEAMVRCLLDAKADPNSTAQKGTLRDPALCAASRYGRYEPNIIGMLLAAKADPRNAPRSGRMLVLGAKNAGHPDVAAMLVNAKACVGRSTRAGAAAAPLLAEAEACVGRSALAGAAAAALKGGEQEDDGDEDNEEDDEEDDEEDGPRSAKRSRRKK